MRLSSAIRGAAWGAVAIGVAAPITRRRRRLPKAAVAVAAFIAPVAVCVAMPRSRKRDVAVCVLNMWAYLAMYEMPHDDPDALHRRVRVRYPVAIDRVLGLGELPGVRLQRALARVDDVGPLDLALTWIHWVWFFVPHSAVLYVLLRDRDSFPRAAVLTYAVFDTGVLAYWVVPTAPPWYAAREGVLGGDPALRRLMVEQGERFWRERWDGLYSVLGGNPLAAMPSLHFATSVMAALVLSDAGPVEGVVGWTYALSLGFALVYLGEHYVVDLVAGLGLTFGVRCLAPHAGPALRAISRPVAALEARARA